MALSAQRHEEAEASLQRIHDYLIALAVEISEAAPHTNKQGHTYPTAMYAANQIVLLRHVLQQEQEHQRIGEEIRRRLQNRPDDGQQ
jgi:hypothetical protein